MTAGSGGDVRRGVDAIEGVRDTRCDRRPGRDPGSPRIARRAMAMIGRGVAIGLLLTTMIACGGGDGSASPATASSPTGGGGEPVTLTITAQNIEFSPASLTVPAGRQLDVTLDNKDAGVPHSLVLQAGPNAATSLFESEVIVGPATLDVTIPGLVPGIYQFSCQVHPNMTTSLTVEP